MVLIRHTNAGFRGNPPDEFCYNVVDIGSVSESFAEEYHMTELEKLCEQALYEEIRDLGDGKSIVRDVPTGRLFYRKELAVYNLQVFSWLKDHKNRSVPRIDSFREEEGRLIVIEEYVQGRTLENLLEEARIRFLFTSASGS